MENAFTLNQVIEYKYLAFKQSMQIIIQLIIKRAILVHMSMFTFNWALRLIGELHRSIS